MKIQNRSTAFGSEASSRELSRTAQARREAQSSTEAHSKSDRSPNSKLDAQTGFTLLEVVVAMAIVGLGVVTVLEVFSLALRLAARSADTTEAVTYGRQVMDEILTRGEIKEGSEEGSSGKKYRWRVQVTPAQDGPKLLSASGWEVKEIALEIRYRDGVRERQLEMKTLRVLRKKGQ